MNAVKELDMAIKLAETGSVAGGYTINETVKETYMTNDEWEVFKESMTPDALEEFGAGGGDEMSEKNGRPPKMASYGSSSRMIYMLSKDKEGFRFEKKLPTTVGGISHIDGFLEEDHRYVFVEAKCHEPYSAKSITVSRAYADLYGYINECMASSLYMDMTDRDDGNMDVKFYADGEEIGYFDLKQVICHLLGIATAMLKGDLEPKQTDFIYLVYDPTELELSKDARGVIEPVYERLCYEVNLVDTASLLRVIFAYLKDTVYGDVLDDCVIENVIFTFAFSLASQEFYPVLLSGGLEEFIF
ncbi:MAG: hypothetical protein IJO81_04705 [Clostridia bacterium]|nr:hypothetical protein [Clostridia bacterium]MBQ6789467.1 hypothetical protein [Clostridia bacterium]